MKVEMCDGKSTACTSVHCTVCNPAKEAPRLFQRNVNHLVGELLTTIDATFTDPTQREAQKTITKETIWDWYYDTCRMWEVGDKPTSETFGAK